MADLRDEIREGRVEDMLPWSHASARELARDWVGDIVDTRGVLGPGDWAAGRVPSTTEPFGWLLAFHMQAQGHGSDARVHALTSRSRIEADVTNGIASLSFDGEAHGVVRIASGELIDPSGEPAGHYHRVPGDDVLFLGLQLGGKEPWGRVELGGRQTALIDKRSAPHPTRPLSCPPLVALIANPHPPAVDRWIVGLCVLELAYWGALLQHDTVSAP